MLYTLQNWQFIASTFHFYSADFTYSMRVAVYNSFFLFSFSMQIYTFSYAVNSDFVMKLYNLWNT